MNLIEQEVSRERWIDIPEEILDILLPLEADAAAARRFLETALDTPARIYLQE